MSGCRDRSGFAIFLCHSRQMPGRYLKLDHEKEIDPFSEELHVRIAGRNEGIVNKVMYLYARFALSVIFSLCVLTSICIALLK